MLDDLFTIVIVAIILTVSFIAYKEYTKSRSYRVRRSVKNFRKLKKEEENSVLRYKNNADEVLSDEDRILTIIRKINTGEEVKIPIAAFQYIYTRLNQICVVDKQGNIQIVNSEEFKRFQQTAINLLDKDTQILKDANSDFNENLTSVFTTKKYPDGTIVKKNNINGDITIVKPDGTKFINKNELNDLIIERPFVEEEDNKKNKPKKDSSSDVNRLKNDNKNLGQENTYLKKQIEDIQNKSNSKNVDNKKIDEEKIEIAQVKTNDDKEELNQNNNEKINIESIGKTKEIKVPNENTNDSIEISSLSEKVPLSVKNVEEKKLSITVPNNQNDFVKNNLLLEEEIQINNQDENKNVEEEIENDNLLILDSLLDKYKPVVTKKDKKIIPDNSEELNKKTYDDEEVNLLATLIEERKNLTIYDYEERFNKVFKLDYQDSEQLINDLTDRKNIMDFVLHLININNKKYSNYYVYSHLEKKIFISIDMLIFKMSCYLKEEDRNKFINFVKPSGLKVCDFNNEVILNFIKKANKYFVLKMGTKPFYLNEDKEIFYVQKFTEFILGEEDKKFFKGAFIILNIKNDFENILIQNQYLEKFEPHKSYIVDSVDGNSGLLHIDRILEINN